LSLDDTDDCFFFEIRTTLFYCIFILKRFVFENVDVLLKFKQLVSQLKILNTIRKITAVIIISMIIDLEYKGVIIKFSYH